MNYEMKDLTYFSGIDKPIGEKKGNEPQKNAYLLDHIGHLLRRCIHGSFNAFVTCPMCLHETELSSFSMQPA
jgi:hypothetical protein